MKRCGAAGAADVWHPRAPALLLCSERRPGRHPAGLGVLDPWAACHIPLCGRLDPCRPRWGPAGGVPVHSCHHHSWLPARWRPLWAAADGLYVHTRTPNLRHTRQERPEGPRPLRPGPLGATSRSPEAPDTHHQQPGCPRAEAEGSALTSCTVPAQASSPGQLSPSVPSRTLHTDPGRGRESEPGAQNRGPEMGHLHLTGPPPAPEIRCFLTGPRRKKGGGDRQTMLLPASTKQRQAVPNRKRRADRALSRQRVCVKPCNGSGGFT